MAFGVLHSFRLVEGMAPRLVSVLAISLLAFESCALAQGLQLRTYRGQVLDEDTKKPLAGVVVVFVWERRFPSPATGRLVDEVHAVREVLTDAEGQFDVVGPRETSDGDDDPADEVRYEVRLTDPIFFKPGYYLVYRVERKGKALRDPTIVYLKRAADPMEALEGLIQDYPFSRTPTFLKALNQERARLGLPPIRPGKPEGPR